MNNFLFQVWKITKLRFKGLIYNINSTIFIFVSLPLWIESIVFLPFLFSFNRNGWLKHRILPIAFKLVYGLTGLIVRITVQQCTKYVRFWMRKYYYGFVSQRDLAEQVEMTFLSNAPENFARWYLMFGDCTKVIRSEALKEQIRSMLSAISIKL